MKKVLSKLKLNDKRHYILAALLAAFIVLDIRIPTNVANMLDTVVGKALIIMVGLSLLAINPLVGILGAIAAYELIRRSSSSSMVSVKDFLPSEKNKQDEMMDYQPKPLGTTVEEEVIAKMLPRTATDVLDTASFKPVQNKLHCAAKL